MKKQIKIRRGRLVDILTAYRCHGGTSFSGIPRIELWDNPQHSDYGALLYFTGDSIELVGDYKNGEAWKEMAKIANQLHIVRLGIQ